MSKEEEEEDDLGSLYRSWNEHKKEKKASNKERSIALLKEKNIQYRELSSDHLRVGEWDYWPSTGLFIHVKTKKRGRGVFNLLAKVKGPEKPGPEFDNAG